MIHDNILGTVGHTPLVRLNRLPDDDAAEVLCKLESFNPTHSIKDRIALMMIENAEREGKLWPGSEIVVVEPTSGNTGIGLAMVCAVKGYRIVLTMPDSMTIERRKLLKALGAELILTPASAGMQGAVDRAKGICEERERAFMPQQFENAANPRAHEKNTALEILAEVPEPDGLVAGVGTGGTITGIGHTFRSFGLRTLMVAVEPAASPVLSGGSKGAHKIQGIGAGFVPKILDRQMIDRIVTVTDEEARSTARDLAKKEGILCGYSSGAAVHAALGLAKELGPDKKVVAILPDFGERYLSTDLFQE
ncbi:MAG: cysteine synthase A [Methanomassiliicoccales archaeon]|nr:cysteine synthase A [Methanomassiliicoccales archaeon]